jgi:hypothetical protein
VKTKETVIVANIDIELNGQNFGSVDTFNYAVSIIASQNEIGIDIKYKIAAASQ